MHFREAYRVFKIVLDDGMIVTEELYHKLRHMAVDSGANMLYDSDSEIQIKVEGTTSAYELLEEMMETILTENARK